jgi:pimeloyl-ACP methyl ester carboxylesterase/tetratricopeptide (TPR) repeat protein
MRLFVLMIGLSTLACASTHDPARPASEPVEAQSLLGESLYRPSLPPELARQRADDLGAAEASLAQRPNDPDALIWVGRRTAYLGRYNDAIDVFSRGIELHPDDARMFRHRGHRWITLRQFDRAIEDLERAASLVEGRADEIEPDGLPNPRGIPTSSLRSNIWYHLALARYLRGDFAAAFPAWEIARASLDNPDNLVAASYWLYLTLRRLGRDADAAAVLEPVTADLDVVENHAYHRLLLMYRGAVTPEQLLERDGTSLDDVTVAYGVAACYLQHGDAARARAIFERIIASDQWPAFGYIAAEAELARRHMPEPVASIDLIPCGPEGEESVALCGTLEVPENYEEPGGRAISLNVIVLRAIEPRRGEAALFELAGGPGIAASGARDYYLGPGSVYRRHRDVVLPDQRGTGESSPLRCPELEHRSPLESMYPLEDVETCRDALETRADLTQYTTVNSAHDLDRVRIALGYDAVDLWTLSYGTELARAYMGLYPGSVRTAVLVSPPSTDMRTPLYHAANAQRALDLMFHECQIDTRCSAAYPDLRAQWTRILERLDEPVRVTRRDPASDELVEVDIPRGPFGEAFRGLFSTAAARRAVPHIIDRAASGDFGPLLDALPPDSSAFAEGLYLSIACSEGTSRIDPEQIARFTSGTYLGDYRVREQMNACSAWPTASIAPDFHEPVATDHPVLVIAAEMDATTPPAYAREICGHLKQCRVIEIAGMGHAPFDLEAWTSGDCFDRLMLDFFERGDAVNIDTTCVATMSPPPFFVEESAIAAEAEIP